MLVKWKRWRSDNFTSHQQYEFLPELPPRCRGPDILSVAELVALPCQRRSTFFMLISDLSYWLRLFLRMRGFDWHEPRAIGCRRQLGACAVFWYNLCHWNLVVDANLLCFWQFSLGGASCRENCNLWTLWRLHFFLERNIDEAIIIEVRGKSRTTV